MRSRKSRDQLDRIRPEIDALLRSMREHLDMDVSFVSELRDETQTFHFVDAPPDFPAGVGYSRPAPESYCSFVADGRMPQLVRDAMVDPIASKLPVTEALSVGAIISVPIQLENGDVYGSLCCLSFRRQPDLGRREYEFARMGAMMCQGLIRKALATTKETLTQLDGLDDMLERELIEIVYQPIYRLRDRRLVTFEALSRFPVEPSLSPDKWFAIAAEANRGIELETIAARRAVELFANFRPNVALSINLSPEAILNDALRVVLKDQDAKRFVVELTEHAPIADYGAINAALKESRTAGLRLAIDDVGAGHSSFRHILELHPEIIKLDVSLTRNIDRDKGRLALAKALTSFSREMGCEVVAEGVETGAEMTGLRSVGVTKIQGYYFGRPMSVCDAATLPATFILDEADDRQLQDLPILEKAS